MTRNFDYPLWFSQSVRSRYLAYLATGASCVSLLGLFSNNSIVKVATGSTSIALGAIGYGCLKTADETSDLIDRRRINDNILRQRSELAGISPDDLPSNDRTPSYVSPDLLTDRTRYPIVFIAGQSGSGKTTLAEYLGVRCGIGRRYAISPHLKPSDFPGFDGYYGGGANYWNEDDSTEQTLDSLPYESSVYEALKAVDTEVYRRLVRYSQAETDFDPIDVYLDETLAISLYFGRKCPDKTLRQFWSNWLISMISEARKTNVRIWVLTQASTADALGLKGASSLKTEMPWLRLGATAKAHIRYLQRQRRLNDSTAAYLLSLDRIALLEDSPLELPSLTEQRAYIEASRLQSQVAPLTTDSNQPSQLAETDENDHVSETDLNGWKPVENVGSEESQTVSSIGTPSVVLAEDATSDESRKEIALRLLGTRRNDGKLWNMTNIIRDRWQIKDYYRGRQLWRDLGLPAPLGGWK